MRRAQIAIAAIFYALLMLYGSTLVGRAGQHFVPLDPAEALRRLIEMPLVAHGSDQRADWMGNLLLPVPLGMLVAALLSPRRRSLVAAVAAFVVCVLFILLVKYAQLFFPPRTVTLNYVIAQSIGAAAGIVLFSRLRARQADTDDSPLERLRLALSLYTGVLLVFLLMPLDFALDPDDLAVRLEHLPDSFTRISGEGRPFLIQFAVLVGGMLALAPVGAMLTITGRGKRAWLGRGVGLATWIGFCLMVGVYMLSCLLISGNPSLPAILFRTIGIALGAWAMHALSRGDPDAFRQRLGRLAFWLMPLYLLALAAVNGLLSPRWRLPGADDLDGLDFVPLYDYYIVTKAQAAKNIVAHMVMYAPVGVLIWARARHGGGAARAFWLAVLLAALVECGHLLRPGRIFDINAIPLAGFAAWLALLVMRALWGMLQAVAAGAAASSVAPNQAQLPRAPLPRAPWRGPDAGRAIGDVEDY